MLHSLRLKNFRAFRNQSFDFSRLNIFVGANSSGKSSAISAINLLAQSVLQRRDLGNPIVLNGPFEELGTFIDVVHGNRANTPISIALDYSLDAQRVHSIDIELKYRLQRREIEISRFDYSFRKQDTYKYSARKDAYSILVGGTEFEKLAPQQAKQKPIFDFIFPFDRSVSRFDTFLSDSRKDNLTSLQNFEEIQGHARNMRRGRTDLNHAFQNFDSLAPFRVRPQRTYSFTGETPSNIGRNGANGIPILLNDFSKRGKVRAGIIEHASDYFAAVKIAKGLTINQLTPRHYELCVVDLDDKKHNIADVGFGCSQVLPVLVGALNVFLQPERERGPSPMYHSPIFVVQEPEIHLHPDAQAALGSFFVGMSRYKGQIFIETHSDNLILRVAQHVALGDLEASDVAIFFCENTPVTKKVTRLSLNSRGAFEPEWPGGFFPQRQSESLALAKARTQEKHQPLSSQLEFIYPERKK